MKNFHINDLFLTYDYNYIINFCTFIRYLREKYDFVYSCEINLHVNQDIDELLKLLHDSGLRKIVIPVNTLDNKDIIIEGVRKFIECGIINIRIEIAQEFKFLNPLDNMELVLLSECRLDITTSFLTPYHGTPIRQYPEKFGFEAFAENLDLSNGIGIATVTCKPVSEDITEIAKQKQCFEIALNKTALLIMYIF